MDIIKEQVDDLNAVVKIHLSQEDYASQVEKSLKEYSKKASMPGFRPGKVPVGMVKKMHGKAIMIEEINKILSNSLYNYISDNKIEILGNPLPKEEKDKQIDWDNQKDFEFSYDLGLSPQIELNVADKHKFDYYLINVDDKLIDSQIDNFRKRYGKVSTSEEISKEDLIHVQLTELNAEGQPLENGIEKISSIMIKTIKDEETSTKLVGLKIEDSVVVDPSKLSENETDLAALLGIKKEDLANISSKFELKVESISRLEPAEMNQDLFDKVFGEGKITTEEDFLARVRQGLQNQYDEITEGKLLNDVADYLIENLKISLPDEFLKKWMVAVSENPVTLEQIENEYDNYSKGLRWQLIENKIIRDNDIKVSQEDLKEYAEKSIKSYYSRYGIWNIKEDEFEGLLSNMLKDKEEVKRLHEKAYDQKILEFFKRNYKMNNKEVTFDEYVNEIQPKK